MLALKPNCECCDRDLPADAEEARICSFECTFCAGCAAENFENICPNCGGELVRRPIRPAHHLGNNPPQEERFVRPHPGCSHFGQEGFNEK